ncbi:MAG: class I SAM-dependent methyltransferase [Thermoplasmata archaeon]|nr:MAG: class I SAM-dependent methyltransferase [Thermoplasmata archaeon]
MTNAATKCFIQDYEAYNKGLKIPHPYFQQVQYVKVNSMIIQNVLERKHDRILDVGSGTGHLIQGLSAISQGCVALDIEYGWLREINKKNPSIACVSADVAGGLPFKENSFDVVIASELLEHLNEPEKFFQEVNRVLKRKGIFILTTPNRGNLSYKIFCLLPKSLAIPLVKKTGVDMNLHPELSDSKEIDHRNPHVHKFEGFTQKELQNLGEDNGLRIIFIRSFGLAIPDRTYSYVPKVITRFIINHIEDHIPYALRHFIVYENK